MTTHKGRGYTGLSDTGSALQFTRDNLAVKVFEECVYPFHVLAVNLGTGKKVVFSEGELAQRVIAAINGMMGIRRIEIKTDTIDIQYDLLQVTEAQIESVLAGIGATLDHGWSERLRRSFVHYFEETEIASLEVQDSGSSRHSH